MVETGDLPKQQQAAAVKAWIDRAMQVPAEDWTAMLYFMKHGRSYIRTLHGLLLQQAEERAAERPTPAPLFARLPPPIPPVSTTYAVHPDKAGIVDKINRAEELLRELREISNMINVEEVFDDESNR